MHPLLLVLLIAIPVGLIGGYFINKYIEQITANKEIVFFVIGVLLAIYLVVGEFNGWHDKPEGYLMTIESIE